MTALERVASTRRTLGAAVAARALLWALASAVALLAIGGAVDWLVGAPRALRALALPTGILLALAAGAHALWRGRRVRSLPLHAGQTFRAPRSKQPSVMASRRLDARVDRSHRHAQ